MNSIPVDIDSPTATIEESTTTESSDSVVAGTLADQATAMIENTPVATSKDAVTPTPEETSTTIPEDASQPALLPEENPPSGAAQQFSTDFSIHTVPYSEILSGGPPKDGIPAITGPEMRTVEVEQFCS